MNEVKKAMALSIYFGTWFCALTFLAVTSLHEHPIPLTIFGLALVKGALSAKFMLIGQAIFPIDSSLNRFPKILGELSCSQIYETCIYAP